MLTEASYHYAIYAYAGAALLALLCLGWWLSCINFYHFLFLS